MTSLWNRAWKQLLIHRVGDTTWLQDQGWEILHGSKTIHSPHRTQTLTYLRARWSYCSSWDFNIKSTLGILLPSQAGIIWRLPTSLPVTDCFPNCLEDTGGGEGKQCLSLVLIQDENTYGCAHMGGKVGSGTAGIGGIKPKVTSGGAAGQGLLAVCALEHTQGHVLVYYKV